MDKLSGATKRLIFIMAGLILLAGLQYQFNIIPIRASREAVVPTAVELTTNAPQVQVNPNLKADGLPTTTPSTKVNGPAVRVNIWAWNAQMGLIYANGGPKTTTGSLMEKNGVRLTITRQDDTSKSQAEQIKFAQKLANGDPNPGEGVHFVIMMGDGSASYLAGINKALDKLGNDYRAEIIGAVGYSGNSTSGEDAFLGPQEWRDDPTKMQGGLVAGVLRDGDWNLAMYYAQQNGIKNNPDETTFDPTALNWVATDDYIKAAELYISGHCEERKIVREGKITSEPKRRVCVQGAVTWTPGDVNIAKKKGGLVKLISTKENAYQMPSVIVGIHKWNVDHEKVVVGFLSAAFDGADQVRNFEPALQRAGKASYAIYAEESPAYWVRYYKGSVERDKTGLPIALGGSRVANLGDNLVLFGLLDGSGDATSSIFRASYEGFGNIAKQQYPKLVPNFPSVADATNVSFLQTIQAQSSKESTPDIATFEDAGSSPISDVVAKRNWSITFETGQSTFTRAAKDTLDELFNALSVSRLSIELDGHTDNVGNPAANQALSLRRAEAVKSYLNNKAPTLFPEARMSTNGFGSEKPLSDNATPEGKAKNRRVTIIIGNR